MLSPGALLLALLLAPNGAEAAAPVQRLCQPGARPLVIDSPGTYDWSCGGSNVGGNDAAIVVRASDVTLIAPVARDSRHCLRIVRGQHVRVVGGRFERCRKFGILVEGSSADVTIEGVTIEDSGNGVYAPTRGLDAHLRLRIVDNRIRRIGGAVDGHGIGLQTVRDSVVARNVIEQTEQASIAVYWWNGETVQSGNVVEENEIHNPAGRGIYFGSSNGTGLGRYDNVVRNNRIRAAQPMYLKGNPTPRPGQWAIEASGNTVDGAVEIGRSGTACGGVRLVGNLGVTRIIGNCGSGVSRE